MADTRWFHRDFVKAAVSTSMGASTHPTSNPDWRMGSAALQGALSPEGAFHIPGGFGEFGINPMGSDKISRHATCVDYSWVSNLDDLNETSLINLANLWIRPRSHYHFCLGLLTFLSVSTLSGPNSLAHRLITDWMAGLNKGRRRDPDPDSDLDPDPTGRRRDPSPRATGDGGASSWIGDQVPQVRRRPHV